MFHVGLNGDYANNMICSADVECSPGFDLFYKFTQEFSTECDYDMLSLTFGGKTFVTTQLCNLNGNHGYNMNQWYQSPGSSINVYFRI